MTSYTDTAPYAIMKMNAHNINTISFSITLLKQIIPVSNMNAFMVFMITINNIVLTVFFML